MRPLLLVTGNPGKLVEARRLAGREIESIALDLPEIQSLDFDEVLAEKVRAAFAHPEAGGRPVIVEEAGLELAAMNRFPGPLVRWMLDAVGAEGISRAALALGDPCATAVSRIAWTDGKTTIVGRGDTKGTLVLPGRGANGFGFDPVFLPSGSERTFGELGGEEKDRFSHRGKAWRDLLARLDAGSR
jgi:XTP/dITP diphosphohydrolase